MTSSTAAIELLGHGADAELPIGAPAYLRAFEAPANGNPNELANLIRAALV